jgi:cytosine/adenosine deaminase-related metal-dependent hydrolase
MTRMLIRGGIVLSMDGTIGDLPRADVLIEDDRIAAIAPMIDAGDAEVIDAAARIVMPGLINAHIHSWQTLVRGLGGDWTPDDYEDVLHPVIAPAYTPRDCHLGALTAALAQLDCGTTTMFDWCHNNPTPEHSDAVIDGLAQAGIRAVFGHGTVKPHPAPGQKHYSEMPHPAAEIARLRRFRLASDSGLVTLAICLLGTEYATPEVCRQDFALAREYGLLSSAHAWGHADRKVPGGYRTLAAEGLLGPAHNVVHGMYLDDEEVRLILDAGASITATPAAELRNHAALPLHMRVRGFGGRPSIGVDSSAVACDRMPDALRFALQSHRLLHNAARLARPPGPAASLPPPKTREVLEWGTINNAIALRLDHRIGSLTPGKQADVIVVRRDTLTALPAIDAAQAMVNYVQAADVETVLVAGRAVKRAGRLTHAALDAHRGEVTAAAARLVALLPPDLRARCSLGPG